MQPNDLPTELSSFVGRHREVAQVRQLLATSRLGTLTGTGGGGKTRAGPRGDGLREGQGADSEAGMTFGERAKAQSPEFAINDRNAAAVTLLCRRTRSSGRAHTLGRGRRRHGGGLRAVSPRICRTYSWRFSGSSGAPRTRRPAEPQSRRCSATSQP